MPFLTHRRRTCLIAAVLVLATAATYWPVARGQYLSVDDHEYVSQNQTVQAGLSWNGVRWAFADGHVANYHPLTWLSHMLDNQLFGPDPGPAHLVNLFLHAVNAVLVFLVFQRMTAHTWASAFIAGLFAVHPQHVESVAWVSERKDVLSALFWLLTMWAYVAYVERPNWPRYTLTLVLFALGLLAKPMVITLPCVLLLMDFWPLRRPKRWRELLPEKVPFLLLMIASSIVTVIAQSQDGAVTTLEQAPISFRVGNALVSYLRYARKFFWPSDLSAFYPLLRPWPTASVVAAAGALVLITIGTLWFWRKRPYLSVGWLWFLGTLVPVIGIVQVGNQAMADRYMYLPMLGLAIAVTWTIVDGLPRRMEIPVVVCAGVVLFACEAVTITDVRYWHDSEALFTRALQRTEPNVFALHSLASAKLLNGNRNGAIADLQQCAKLQPGNPHVRRALGYALREAGRYEEAHAQLKNSLQLNPRDGRSWEAMARLLADQGKWVGAAKHYAIAAEMRPDDYGIRMALAAAHYQSGDREAALADLRAAQVINASQAQPWHMAGVLLLEMNQPTAALEALRRASALAPGDVDTLYRIGVALMRTGRGADAVAPLMRAVTLSPGSPEPMERLAWLLSTHPDAKVRSGQDALYLATRASEMTAEQSPQVLEALAAAQAEQRQFDDAATTAAKAMKLAHDAGNAALAEQIRLHRQRYQAGRALRDPTLASADTASAVP